MAMVIRVTQSGDIMTVVRYGRKIVTRGNDTIQSIVTRRRKPFLMMIAIKTKISVHGRDVMILVTCDDHVVRPLHMVMTSQKSSRTAMVIKRSSARVQQQRLRSSHLAV